MGKLARSLLVASALALLHPCSALAQAGSIEQIEVQGLFRMTREAFMHALDVKVGDPYDVAQLRRRYRKLWQLGLFEDLSFEVERAAGGGTLLVIKLKERPVLTSVTYEEVGSVTRTEIEDRLRERGGGMELGKPLDIGAVVFAEGAVRDLLGEKGFLDAEVKADVQRVTETTRAVHFSITPGGKTRIRKIRFTGNELFSNRKLKSQLELTQERKWYWPWSAKNLYHPGKWDQDVIAVRELYQNQGYLDIVVRPPVVEVVEDTKKKKKREAKQKPQPDEQAEEAADLPPPAEESPAFSAQVQPEEDLTPKQRKKQEKKRAKEEKQRRKKEQQAKKVKRWVHLTVPVSEGSRYTLGEISFTGNEVFEEQILRSLIPLKQGEVLRNNLLDLGIDQITLGYENRGHLYATVVRRIQRHEDETVADVEISIEEDEPYYVSRIEFAGNTSTHDRVLRREVLLYEGERFNRTKLDLSRRKLNQLGYFQIPTDPVIEPVEGENQVNVVFSGEEQGRNEIQIGGGYSGLDGAFFNGVYSTRNFLGRGQIVSLALQVGGRSNRYQLSFQEPWFLNRPLLFGFSLFRRDVDYGASLRSTSDGFGLILGKRLTRFTNLNLGYNWESVSSTTFLTTAGGGIGDQPTSITSEVEVSSLTPFYSYNTINNPYRPTRGKSFSLSFQVAGGPLGGDTSFLKPIARFTGYRRGFGRTYMGLHAQVGLIREFRGNASVLDSSEIEGVPRFQRFWLGGDTLGPRVFETRSITPLRYVILDDEGRISEVLGDPRFMSPDDFVLGGGLPVLVEAGGDRFFLLQTEIVQPLNEQAELAFFFDVGDTLFEDQSWGFDTARMSAGIELRFHLPIFPVPLRLIYGWPVREIEGDRTGNFTFSIGRSF